MTTCPCCGSAVEVKRPLVNLTTNVVVLGDRRADVRPKVAEFIDVLSRAWPAPVRRGELISAVWGMNEPDSANTGVRLLAYQARKALRGWPVTFRGGSAGYSMQWRA